MSQAIQRSILRWIHIVVAIPSAISIAHLTKFQTTHPLHSMSSFL